MPAIKKIEQVDQVAKKLDQAKSIALLQYQGLTANEITELRAQVKAVGGHIEVVKNSLIIRALEKIGIKLPEILTGPTAITYCNEDEVAPLKEIDKINKEKEVTSFKYGIFNKKLLSLEEFASFISLPSKNTLLSQFVGGLANPLQRLVYALRFNQTKLVLTLKALSQKES